MIRQFLFCLGILTLAACSPKVALRPATSADLQLRTDAGESTQLKAGCYDPLAYVEHPELIRMRYLRVNFHFMNSSDGRYNMPAKDMVQFARDWIYNTNENLSKNEKMFLPPGNNTPVIPIPYRYVITTDPGIPDDTGIYQHIDDTLCYVVKTGRERNISDKRMIKKYAVNDDTVLNVFVVSHHLDSVSSKTYKADGSGISLGSSVKLFGQWNKKPSPYDYRGVFNHEIGHSLGLSHTWGGHDGCDDTPAHPNCYNKGNTPPCDSLYSNNMMDYNLWSIALTPCQIGKILMHMANLNSIQRAMLLPNWCDFDPTATIAVTDSVRWRASADISGNIVVENGGRLEIACRLSIPAGATVTVKQGGTLVLLPTARLHNACGDQWGGIILETVGKTTGTILYMEGAKIEDSPLVPGVKS